MNFLNSQDNTLFFSNFLKIIDGLFLLFLAISGNFIAETLGCQTQELLSNSTWAKQAMTFFIIFFTLDYSESEVESPGSKFIKALFVYFFFLLFAKMDIIPTIIVFVLLIALYVSNSYKKYYEAVFKKKVKPNKQDSFEYAETKKYMDDIQKFLMGSVIVIILAGFALYFKEKKIEYKSDFSFHKFIFGVVKCKGMK
jgi:hypothetical protein